ncbi:hypothetical protein DL93DRAFT_2169616 [Clavulina sp. PMI_390]|nr:hypothetical protein DL93DRAFT_2169616 [Clavulina sp. PMI_390]
MVADTVHSQSMGSSVQIPTELLGHVFFLSLPEKPDFRQITHQYDSNYSSILPKYLSGCVKQWGSLRLVCSQWSAIVMETPSLWSTIVVETPSSHSQEPVAQLAARVTAQLTRAKALPLDIVFAASMYPFPDILLQKIGREIHRAHTLWVIGPYWQRILGLAFGSPTPPSRLLHLKVHDAFRPMKPLLKPVREASPEFKPATLQLSRVDFTAHITGADFSQLVELDLEASIVTSESLAGATSRAPALELLRVPYDENINCGSIPFPRLGDLTLLSISRELGPGHTVILPQAPCLHHLQIVGSSLLSVTLPDHPRPQIITVNYLGFYDFGLPMIPYPISELRLQNFPVAVACYQQLSTTISERSQSNPPILNSRCFTISFPPPFASSEDMSGFTKVCKTILQGFPQGVLQVVSSAGANQARSQRWAAEEHRELLGGLWNPRLTFIPDWPV